MVVQKGFFGEGTRVEFKAEIPKKREKFLKDIIAFANTSGGKTILGVEDKTGEIVGLGDQNPFKLSDAISNMVSDACTPMINMEITPKTIDAATIFEIEVFPGRFRPYYLASVGKELSSYVRVNGTSRPADARKLKELEFEGLRISYDMTPEIGAEYNDEAVKALMTSMYQTALSACRSDEERQDVHPLTVEKLEDFGVLCKQGREYLPTRAFTLLTKPTDRNVKIQCALFKGVVRDVFIDKKEFYGPIQNQLEEAYQFVLRHINCSAVIDGLYRRDCYELPTKSIREIIANACMHRSYLDSSSIQVSIYDDRIEVDSPGMLYDGLNVMEATSGKSKCRNKAVAEAFQYMKIVEGWGTGLPRLFRQCQEMGLPEPKFEEFGDGIKATIYRAIGDRSLGLNDPKKGSSDPKNRLRDPKKGSSDPKNRPRDPKKGVSDPKNAGHSDFLSADLERKIVELILRDGKITQKRIAEELGISLKTVKRNMSALQRKGTIERVGANKGGYWKARG